ncbi:DUF1272 domain-containing protein [Solemya velum gill symbiont]|uniref:Urease n=1 Tax=Solemya velum gill symbiont TaxID=2340 RepID=A0A0B0HG15_SOVGS|nr:DUF1272 domain-containing protein [Solemya velum gill symbiont]KHF26386.1 hypothetical protein JV46_29870 [Solemya velum gill symbiont]OOY48894.1 urease [Solemya velum gill symbiont]OOY50396.1 urease [Solemya velum gill symbiont]OOY59649.1 urease [Solemya velum gill symbiont]OOY63125.1 urease [Solemya velum gill symbiont]
MLELRPTCEHCNKALPPNSTEAMICSFECTFCKGCADDVLENVCPNCGGGFTPRPIRPKNNLKDENFLGESPATDKITYKPVDTKEHQAFAKEIKTIPPEER